MPTLPFDPTDQPDLTEYLSEVRDVERQANNPVTRDFLEAGKRLLRRDLLHDDEEAADVKGQPPFEEVLAWVTQPRVVGEAQRTNPDRTMAALRYRWQTKVGYLRDLVISVLSPRMALPGEVKQASRIIHNAKNGDLRLSEAIAEITTAEVQALKGDHAFRLQMIFQATFAHDDQVGDALRRIDRANVDAWAEFLRQSFDEFGMKLRDELDFPQLSRALHAACQGTLFRTMLPSPSGHNAPPPADLLTFIAKALIIAAIDQNDGRTIDEFLNGLAEGGRPGTAGEAS